ncbi:hypothetical protein KC323_g6674 [Hortaea werneckii]|uniref:Structure-specific endonuclease subunit SLX4 n=1 Tax=Hortaea werneckii TaxID=91943 RepID=A0A3M7HB34_HORWE|nr:hypothetical protein KC323_g6674 [Hortaea werneckii]KAI7358930.1 hypothetical protein KC320_g844 [Hortaea werneckii]RMZ10092.1 hypothetical protein D0862_03366 [Hortaea werneckii]
MAGANPILIQSSPTSPAGRRRAPVPSSPQLPSPSSFIRPLSSGFPAEEDQRGLRAPDFQSAASLLPLAREDATGGDDGGLAARETTETAGKLKKPRRRMKKSESIILNSDEPEESIYFARKSPRAEPPKRPPAPSADHHEGGMAAAQASRRRRSWTPVMDTAIHVPSPAPRVPLGELLSNFSYTNSNPGGTLLSAERVTNGEATTKRRKIELADSSTSAPVTRQPAKKASKAKSAKKDEKASESTEMPPPKPTKRPKGPKKPQTITALATKAYQPQLVEPEVEQSTVSAFFTPRKQDLPAAHNAEETATEAAKVKKPREPRQPKEGSDAAKGPAKQKATTKPKKAKAKVKFNEADFLPPLYSPEKAALQMQQQDFLFGTSSQLATDEDPKFIRELQTAMAASEIIGPSTQAPAQRESSYAKVPSAPHGTSLTVGQADRELWCSAARDFKGGLHREKSGLNRSRPAPAAQAAPKESSESAEAGPSCVKSPAGPMRAPVDSNTSHKQGEAAAGATTATTLPEPDGFIDIDDIYDDDPSPPTPSPPRRRPSSTASPIQPLTFSTTSTSTPTSAQNKQSTALAPTAYLKSTDPQWSTINPLLFPQITHAIRTQTPSINPSHPSWNQKILLYDPIVLEDLTAWLNDTIGLRIPVQRKVAKKHQLPRGKSGEKDEEIDHEVEVKDEEVRCWMVQKWCEERSLCCLWKEGLRGGVRSRY